MPEGPYETQDVAGRLAQRLTSQQIGRASLPLILLFAAGILIGFREGFASSDTLLLSGGAILSGVTMFFFALPPVLTAYGRPKKLWMFFGSVGGFVPYLWSISVILLPGLWAAVQEFSLAQLAASGFFALAGYWFLRTFWRLTELGKQIQASTPPEP